MTCFIVPDYDQYKVHLFDEESFRRFVEAEPVEDEELFEEDEFVSPQERIERLVGYFGYDIAWCRDDAMTMIAQDIEGGCLDASGSAFLIGAAGMLIQLVDNSWWDRLLLDDDAFC